MGAGKSTLGKMLATKLNIQHVDLDNYIATKHNNTISEIFELHGQEYFRKYESDCLKEVSKSADVVISTGGGTPCWGDNMKFLKESGITIYLKCDPNRLADRLINSKTVRPLVVGKSLEQLQKFIKETLDVREQYYNQASVIIDNPSRDVTQLMEVLKYYNN